MPIAFFQDTNGILYRTLVLGLLYLGRQDDRVVALGSLSVIFVQLWGNPVSVGNNSLLAIVEDNQCGEDILISEVLNRSSYL